jgi:hypothetical protein
VLTGTLTLRLTLRISRISWAGLTGVGIAQVLLAVPAQDVLVADQQPLDVGVLVGHADQRRGLLGVDLARLAAELSLASLAE